MTSTLDHRGPDAFGTYLSPLMALGHTRLSIVDLSDGHQPMVSDRYALSFNGEIFNHPELRDELQARGHAFKTKSDTEVVLKAFTEYGTEAFAKLNGQFAILIWDRREQTLTIARDRFGIRPLYILEHTDKRWYFASEMKAFDTLPHYNRAIDPQMLLEHATLWNTLHDDTIYKSVHSHQAGTWSVYKGGKKHSSGRYHEIGRSATPQSNITFVEAKEQFHEMLTTSVDLRLRADVPVGAYLSGGIDSTVIASLTKARKDDDFETFSVAFKDKEYDESSFQIEVSEDIQSAHAAVEIDRQDIDDHLFHAVYHTERPIFRTAPVPLYRLSNRVRSSDIRVVLTGEGADEYLYGYDAFKELSLLQQWKASPDSETAPNLIKKLYPHLSHYADPTRFGMMKMYYEGFLDRFDNELCGLNIRAHNNRIISKFINQDHHVDDSYDRTLERVRSQIPEEFKDWTVLQRNSYLELRTLLAGYLLSSQGDRMALGHGIEGRFPFLDHNLVDTVFHYPDAFKLSDFDQKHILKETFKGQIPDSVLNRPKRPYMAPDLVSFFKDGGLTERAEQFLSPAGIAQTGIFEEKKVRQFVNKYSKRMPKEIGYRDNMIITFLLSTQMALHWSANPSIQPLDEDKRTTRYNDYP